MDDLETQDKNIEYLKSFYEEDFDALADKVWSLDSTDYHTLEGAVNTLLQEFAITCKEVYRITDPNHYFELMLIDYDLPSLMDLSRVS